MATDVGRVGDADQALVASDGAATHLHPSGFDPSRMEKRLSELLALETNWNGYRAPPIDPACAERVRRFYPIMETLGLQPWITPDNNGGLTIERAGTDDYSVELHPDRTVAVYFDGLSDADAWGMVGLFAQLKSLDAIAMEAASAGETEGLDGNRDSAGLKGIAQTQSDEGMQ